jgi:hypothetical protein
MRPATGVFLFLALLLLSILLRTLWLAVQERGSGRSLRRGPSRSCFLCLTTVPSRISSPGFVERLAELAALPSHDGLVLSVPWIFKRTGEAYVVPAGLAGMPRLRIYRCEDEGPGTKALAPLRNEELPAASALMVCDDDTFYHSHVFQLLADSIMENPFEAHSICSGAIQGYLGFGAVKEVLLPLLSLEFPEACRTVDDTFFQEGLQQLGVRVNPVELPGCLVDCRLCAIDILDSLPINLLDKNGLSYQEVIASDKRKLATQACVRQLRAGGGGEEA